MPAVLLIWAVPAYGSIATCIVCALAREWWCFVSILMEIYSRAALGMGRLTVTASSDDVGPMRRLKQETREEEEEKQQRPSSAPQQKHSPTPADSEGLLLHECGVVVLRGNKSTVFFASENSTQINVGLFALVIQFLTQLVLIPRGTLFGQLMFVVSLAVSSMYNIYLAICQDTLQTQYLLDLCGLDESSFRTITMSSKACMAIFACLALRHQPVYAPRKLLDELAVEQGVVRERWKDVVARKLENEESMVFSQEDENIEGLDDTEKTSLAKLLKDAEEAYRTHGWQSVGEESSGGSVSEKVEETRK
ncbi:hypothetical protein C8T65DRAFT_646353 [Cerioporus squamosus]|nr:hypothetical protein C8T65DRAFT_646353 [Cerioporus squamosus]